MVQRARETCRNGSMAAYLFTLFGKTGPGIAVETVVCSDDAEATAKARSLFEVYPLINEIVVSRDRITIARMSRD